MLLTTQYLDEADQLADSIAVIDHGEVIAEGTSDELKDRVGGEKLEVTLENSDQRRLAIDDAHADLRRRDGRPATARSSAMPMRRERGGIAEAVRRLDERRRRDRRTSRSAARRSTTSSWSLTGHAAEDENGESKREQEEIEEREEAAA